MSEFSPFSSSSDSSSTPATSPNTTRSSTHTSHFTRHQPTTQQLLERAMREAVDFIHAEGWDQPPTLFGLVPGTIIARETGNLINEEEEQNLTLVVQDLPEIGSGDELHDYVARTAWPPTVAGAILAHEIMFTNAAEPGSRPRKARLFSGMINGGPDLTLLQLRPTEEELDAAGAFGQDNIELLGGPDIAPEIVELLRSTFEPVEDSDETPVDNASFTTDSDY